MPHGRRTDAELARDKIQESASTERLYPYYIGRNTSVISDLPQRALKMVEG